MAKTKRHSSYFSRGERRGAVAVLTAFLLVAMLSCLALAVDIGVVSLARSELQRSADAAALAAAWELIDDNSVSGQPSDMSAAAQSTAVEFAALNSVIGASPALSSSNVQIGHLVDPSDPNEVINQSGASPANTVQVTLHRSTAENGSVPTFFARIFGVDHVDVQAQATAALRMDLSGFETPYDNSSLELLPFALDVETWDALLQMVGDDDWSWNQSTGQVEAGPDGVLEVNLYPKGNGSPGNRGTVDIGSSNNSTADIARQILTGVNDDDLSYHNGVLEFDAHGELFLNGDTGISAGVKDELEDIKGQPRVIPIFSDVNGNGNNATYTIVRFAGVRIMEVKLTGNKNQKRVIIQPATIVVKGARHSASSQTSNFIYSPVTLVR
ncbi:MAG: TadG family pilus assembly protein [Pirellulaceae bacterium]|jgi:Flp pilus assembly protein TadG|nr:TadG family pilus assembly protein [Pirellulaceae bacterium]MDP7020312.1 TadG family pilus assembly protein [Pirellulaceae bacterium]